MLDAYGLAAAHLSELKRTQDEARARYDRGLATEAVRRPGIIRRIAARFGQSRSRAVAAAEDRTAASCGGCLAPTRIAT